MTPNPSSRQFQPPACNQRSNSYVYHSNVSRLNTGTRARSTGDPRGRPYDARHLGTFELLAPNGSPLRLETSPRMPNLKLALRALFKTPFVTTVACVSLALGIGANAAIYSLFNQILLRPLPVQEPGKLVDLSAPGPKPGSQSCNQAGDCDAVFSYAMFRDLERVQDVFTGIAGHRLFGANLALRGQTPSTARARWSPGRTSRSSASLRRSAACSDRAMIRPSAPTSWRS